MFVLVFAFLFKKDTCADETCTLVLHSCKCTMSLCTLVLQGCERTMSPCTLVLHGCKCTMSTCTLVLQGCERTMSTCTLPSWLLLQTQSHCSSKHCGWNQKPAGFQTSQCVSACFHTHSVCCVFPDIRVVELRNRTKTPLLLQLQCIKSQLALCDVTHPGQLLVP